MAMISPVMISSIVLASFATLAAGSVLRARAISASLCTSCPPYIKSSAKRCLLISNSKLAGLDYLAHAIDHIRAFLGPPSAAGYILFVPFAQRDRDAYFVKFRKAISPTGFEVKSLHEYPDAVTRRAAVEHASAIFVGGGNTYRLLKCLQADGEELLPLVASRVAAGDLKYIGSSAGTNMACPTIRNTNDMPIVWPDRGLSGLCLVPFQINTHYIDEARELKNHMGETRAKRLEEFVEENDVPVLALREGSSVLVEGERAVLCGPGVRSPKVTWQGARLIRRAADGGPCEVGVGEALDELMALGNTRNVERLFDVMPLLSDAGQRERRGGGAVDNVKSG